MRRIASIIVFALWHHLWSLLECRPSTGILEGTGSGTLEHEAVTVLMVDEPAPSADEGFFADLFL